MHETVVCILNRERPLNLNLGKRNYVGTAFGSKNRQEMCFAQLLPGKTTTEVVVTYFYPGITSRYLFIRDKSTGIDFLYTFSLAPDLRRKSLIRNLANLKVLSKIEYGLCISVEKCQFGKSIIEFLGFKLSAQGIEPLLDHVKCILEFPQQTALTQLRIF
ncbi:retrovirus-related Pol polyprotein from transposon 17.6 [Nephila pilipes]|uniref:Retrovirus-related Pol polyprotein from transposon 17.6 n=1 Tax=Nephila pilipes TaxID=299642 RepID=A0A8X6QS51_NEPPI|nr:retrovirus-related Pol polyprotein from transposon 17.6 [Nephila pilipes]